MRKLNLIIAKPAQALLRGVDSWGSGAFGAGRGSRKHNGIDFAADKNSFLVSPVSGYVSKFGFPYSDPAKINYRYVEVVDIEGYQHRFMYVLPARRLALGDTVKAGDVLGTVQDIAKKYRGMKNHVHYEVKRKGKYINPNEFWGRQA